MTDLQQVPARSITLLINTAGEAFNGLSNLLIDIGGNVQAELDPADLLNGNVQPAVLGKDFEVLLQDGHANDAAVGKTNVGAVETGRSRLIFGQASAGSGQCQA